MILDGFHTPEDMVICSDHGFGCTFGCDRMRPIRPGWVWLDPI